MAFFEFARPKKSLGQNFLMHASIAERIVHAAKLPPGSTVLEVGPGRGILTKALLAQGVSVIAVEADRDLAHMLRDMFSTDIARGALTVIEGDIREYSFEALPQPYHVVANIPYYLTGDLMRKLLESAHQPESMTLLVQKEVAERIARAKKESILSLSVKAYGTPRYEFTVPRGAFVPAPTVDSAVLSIRSISRARFASKAEEERFFALIRAGFAHKRKFLANNLAELGLSDLPLAAKVRAEDLALEEWLALTKSARI